jgi:hypothetical protein
MEIVSQEENNLWKTMLKEMKMRHHRDCRKLYYPFKMHVWDRENKEIEAYYRKKISNLINERRKVEKVEEEKRNVRKAAETLLLFAQADKKEFLRSNNGSKKVLHTPSHLKFPPSRSQRIKLLIQDLKFELWYKKMSEQFDIECEKWC